MKDTIRDILAKIESLNNDLREEYDHLSERYGFYFEKKKVVFLEQFRRKNKSKKLPSWKYIIPTNIRHFLSIPFIYGMIIPAIILDIALTIYQYTAFSLYHIPYVKRREFFIYERRFLDYLNLIQKMNCLYCSYMNWLFSYAVEIGARTERYWCPIKAAHKPKFSHGWYSEFADYGNPEEWAEKSNQEEKAFIDVYGDTCIITK